MACLRSLLPVAALLVACAGPSSDDAGFVETSGGECLAAPDLAPPGPTVTELDVPEPVRAALSAIFGDDATLEVDEEEGEDGSTQWEVEHPNEMELELADDGTVSALEFAVPRALLPSSVAQAAQACWGEAELDEVEVVVRGAALLWEVEAEVGEEQLEAVFRPDGGFEEGDACRDAAEREGGT